MHCQLGLLSVLGCIFVVLKLCCVINWSWWWVLLPWWGPAGLIIIGVLIWLLWIGCFRFILTFLD